jgi:flavin-binding protein dodecin
VAEVRGLIRDGQISKYQVTLKVGFRLEEGKNPFEE